MSLFLFALLLQTLSLILGAAIIGAFWKIRRRRSQLLAEISHADSAALHREGRVAVALYDLLLLACTVGWLVLFLPTV